MILLAVFLLSFSSLFFEVLLTRIFSITQFNHLTFMVISIALFGFAASGTFLNIIDSRQKNGGQRLTANTPLAIVVLLYSTSVITAFTTLNQIPLDYFRLPIESIQILYLLAAYLLLALPFFFTGLIVSVAYAFLPEKTGLVYCANMAGSACGAIMPVVLIPLFSEGDLVMAAALIPLIILPVGQWLSDQRPMATPNRFWRSRLVLPAFGLGIVLGTALITLAGNGMFAIKPSPYKALSQMLQYPATRITATTAGIRGRIDTVKSPYIRFAPGLSLKFNETLPGQDVIFKDGDDPFYVYHIPHSEDRRFAQFTLLWAGYLLTPNPDNILLIQSGAGGLGIPCALASGAREITVVQPHPQIAHGIRRHYELPVFNQHPRAFLARDPKRFRLIHVENWGASLPGSDALTQQSLLTVEALVAYLNHLKKDGILIFTRKLLLPPADSIRLWATAYESLKRIGIEKPGQHLALLRDWSTFTLIVSLQPLHDIDKLAAFARSLNFDLVYLKDLDRQTANRFNIFEQPFHFLEIKRLAEAYQAGTAKAYFNAYPLDVVPQTDNRPFPGRFLKWPHLKTLYKMSGGRFYSLFMSGEIVVAVVFLEATGVALLLLILPLAAIPKQNDKPYIAHILYFLAVGAGFMFLELFFIKKYIFVFGDPVVSFMVVLTGILVFSSVGGYCSQRIGPLNWRYSLMVLIVALIFVIGFIDGIVDRILSLGTGLRYLAAIGLLIPCGLLTGLPLPLGLRHLLQNPAQRAYAWSANGCASVLAAVAAAQIALCLGISTILLCALAAYLLALISAKAAMISVDKNTKIC